MTWPLRMLNTLNIFLIKTIMMKVWCLVLTVIYAGAALSLYKTTLDCDPVFLNITGIIWKSYKLYPNPEYRQLVLGAAAKIREDVLQRKALKIADVGTFIWV